MAVLQRISLHLTKEKNLFYSIALILYDRREKYSYDVILFHVNTIIIILQIFIAFGTNDEMRLQNFVFWLSAIVQSF